MASYVGIDLHRRRSVIVVMSDDGEVLSSSKIENSALNLETALRAIAATGDGPVEVAMEATWGWYWAADVMDRCGVTLHLAHPLGVAGLKTGG